MCREAERSPLRLSKLPLAEDGLPDDPEALLEWSMVRSYIGCSKPTDEL